MPLLQLDLVRTTSGMIALGAEWADLWRRAGASPFQHPAWLLPWWSQFGTDAPRIVVLRGGDGRMLGLLPLYDLAAEGKMLPLGVGLSDYCDALLDPAAPPDTPSVLLAQALSGCLLECHLPDLPPGAVLRAARPPPGWVAQDHPGPPCPVLLPDCIPGPQRRKLRMSRHRAERIGGFEVVNGGTDLFADLVRLHSQRWDGHGVLRDPHVLAFHAAAVPALSTAGLLRLRGLRLAGRIVAVIYALQSHGRLFFYISGFDRAHAFQSPGTILLGAMIEEAQSDGLAELHFLRGAESYKYAWGAVDRFNLTRMFQRA